MTDERVITTEAADTSAPRRDREERRTYPPGRRAHDAPRAGEEAPGPEPPARVRPRRRYLVLGAAVLVAAVVGFRGAIQWDTSKPDGTPRKLLDVSRLRALGWQPKISLETGIRQTYEWFRQNVATNQSPK